MSNQRRFALIGRGFGSDSFDEAVQDLIAALLVDSSEIDFTYTDATPSITAALTGTTAQAFNFTNATTALKASSVTPRILWNETDAGADSKNWGIDVQSGVMRFRAWDDALSGSETFWTIARTGTNIDGFTLSADFIELAGFISFSSGSAQFLGSGSTQFIFSNTAAAADNKTWVMKVSGETWQQNITNDAGSVTTAWVTVERTGTTVDEIQLDATSLDLNAALDLGGSFGTASQSLVMSAGSGATPSWLTAGTNDRLLRQTGGVLNFGQLTAGMFPNTVVPDAALSANVPLLNITNTFTSGSLIVSGATAGLIRFIDLDAGTDQKVWEFNNNDGAFTIVSRTDALSAVAFPVVIAKDTSGLITDIVLRATTLTLGTASTTLAAISAARADFDTPIQLKGYTVAGLPAGAQGDIAYVTNALAPAFLTAVVGGGAVVTPVFYDGTNWVAM